MPKHVSNLKGSLMLGYLKDGSDDEHLGEFAHLYYSCKFPTNCSSFYQEHTLAEGFDIKDGSVSIKCPEVDPGKEYIVVRKSPRYFIVNGFPRLSVNSSIRRFWQP
jgi:hypothetical protein